MPPLSVSHFSGSLAYLDACEFAIRSPSSLFSAGEVQNFKEDMALVRQGGISPETAIAGVADALRDKMIDAYVSWGAEAEESPMPEDGRRKVRSLVMKGDDFQSVEERFHPIPGWTFTSELLQRMSCLLGLDLYEASNRRVRWTFLPSSLLLGTAYTLYGAATMPLRPMAYRATETEMRAMTEAGERPLLMTVTPTKDLNIHGVRNYPAYGVLLHDMFHYLVLNLFDDGTRAVFLALDDCVDVLPASLDLIKPLLHEAFLDGPNLRPEDIAGGFKDSKTFVVLFATVGSYLTDLFASYTGLKISRGHRAALVRDFAAAFLPILETKFSGHPKRDEIVAAFRYVFKNFLPV